MKIRDMFKEKTVFSFEVFPPKKTSSIETVYQMLEELEGLTPDFISVTFSAGGSGNSALALDIASKIREDNQVEPVLHLPCINYSKEEILAVLSEVDKRGIENILALRGDINPDIPPKNEFRYASDLISFIKERGDYDVAGACYPEVHVEAADMVGKTGSVYVNIPGGMDKAGKVMVNLGTSTREVQAVAEEAIGHGIPVRLVKYLGSRRFLVEINK